MDEQVRSDLEDLARAAGLKFGQGDLLGDSLIHSILQNLHNRLCILEEQQRG
jgi:hypothetical protein